MAVVSVKEKASLRLVLDNGVVDGKQKIMSKTFNKIKTTVEDEDLYGVAVVLGNLQNKEVLDIRKVEETILSEE